MTPRAKADNKKEQLLVAAMRVFARDGLTAPTASIAKEAGVANGTLFNNFATKAELLNELYLGLKLEVIQVALAGMPEDAALKDQAKYVWTKWTLWGAANPEKRRTLSLLCMSDEITGECMLAAQNAGGAIGGILTRITAGGHLRDMPHDYVMSIVEALAGATIDFMIGHPQDAERHSQAGFETLWRALS